MRKLIMLVAVLSATAALSLAQDHPSTEIFGGYSYINTKASGERTSMHGWSFSVTGNFGPRWGGVAEFSGNYRTTEFSRPGGTIDRDTSVYSFLFGPRISARGGAATGFGHVLFGGARLKVPQQSRTDFAMAIGAGVDINAGKSFAIRLGQADYFPNRIGGQWNSDFRFQAGVVVKLGGN